jgi:hypothetical protein
MGDGEPYGCHLFSVDKFLANGYHDKFKSQMEMNGNEQGAVVFPDRSLLTIAIHPKITCVNLGCTVVYIKSARLL